ncbi:uncharacterized protein LOC117124474 [Anneissia japonica]|uniref:uncharacterized protein LOC117124474 n=1 Tax=Anneissia japonica TaxID=1529436 RepID=UPI001425AAE5|nr:uncharacterized protein LOC117124474 [Anneissia japonica]
MSIVPLAQAKRLSTIALFKRKMKIYRRFAVLVALSMLGLVRAAFNPEICTPYTPSIKQPPNFPPVFYWRMEVNENERLTVDVEQWVDHYKQSMSVIYNGAEIKTISDYYLMEQYILTYKPYYFDRGIPECDVLDIDLTPSVQEAYSSNSGPLSALLGSRIITNRFRDDYPSVYIGESDVRGIPCDHYRTCAYYELYDATFVMDYYISKSGYQTASGIDQVPVRAVVVGEAVLKSGVGYPINFVYELLFFRNDPIPATVFQTPPGVSCPNRTNTTPIIPTPPDQFQLRVEEIVDFYNIVVYADEWYDYSANLIRYDYAPVAPLPGYTYGLDPMSEIHDYNTGIAYLIDKYTNNCTAMPIYNSTSDSVPTDDPHYIRMKTGYEMFGYDQVNYKYEGQRTVRGILCHVWVGSRTNWPPNFNKETTWEFYWTAEDWVDDTGVTRLTNEPIQQRIYFIEDETDIVINVYKYNEEPITYADFDISSCYNEDARKAGQFQMSGMIGEEQDDAATVDYVSNNELLFVENVRRSIADAAKVSPIRIVDITVRYASRVWVAFTLLDTPDIQGDVANPVNEPGLSEAFTNIETAINIGYLKFTMTSEEGGIDIFALPKTLSEEIIDPNIPMTDLTYSPGVMAGAACGSALIGFTLSFSIKIYIDARSKNGS